MQRHILTALIFAAPFAGAAAQDSTRTPPQSVTVEVKDSQPESQNENAVLMRMHRTNQLEIRVGQLAQRNGGSAKVKSFGAELVRDHSAADQKVTALAQQLGVTLGRDEWMDTTRGRQRQRADSMPPSDTLANRPSERQGDTSRFMPRDSMRHGEMKDHGQGEEMDHGRMIQRLSTLRGAAFDAEFAKFAVQGHEKTLKMLEQAQNQVQRPELRTLIQNTLPAVRRHLQVAQSLAGTSTTTSSSQQ